MEYDCVSDGSGYPFALFWAKDRSVQHDAALRQARDDRLKPNGGGTPD